MNIAEQYLRSHLARRAYTEEMVRQAEEKGWVDGRGWIDHFVDEEMIFSHRKNPYTRETFSEGLHTHGYYELIVYVHGEIEYIQNDTVVKPKFCSVIWFPPGQMHTARLVSASTYERYVLYFSPEFFVHNRRVTPMLGFMEKAGAAAFHSGERDAVAITALLEKAEETLRSETAYRSLLAKAVLIELFGVLNTPSFSTTESDILRDSMSEVKYYIDTHYATISGIAEIAEKFFYSREHLSRRFKSKFNVSISDYLSRRRVVESLRLLSEMSIAEACYAVGFNSQSAYISAFVRNIGCLPSEYKKRER